MDAKGATVKNNNMNRYIVKANNEPQISMDKITYAIEYIHSCMGKKDWNLFFINNNYSIYDTEKEKTIWSTKLNFKLNQILKFKVYDFNVIGKFIYNQGKQITIETISDAVCPAGEIQTINSHFLCS